MISLPTSRPAWLDAQYCNIAVATATLVYYKFVQEYILRHVVERKQAGVMVNTKPYTSLLLSSTVLFWPLYDAADWTWRFNTLLPMALFLRYIYKGMFVKDFEDVETQALAVSSPSDLLFGPSQFAAILIWLGLSHFRDTHAAIIIAAIGIADGALAPLFGVLFGRHDYNMLWGPRKTMEGSIVGVFGGTVAAYYVYAYVFGIIAIPLRAVLAFAGVAAAAEAIAPGNLDNLCIVMAINLSKTRII